MLLKSGRCQVLVLPTKTPIDIHILYSPYLGSLSSSIRLCIDSGDGRRKQRQRKWRIFSRFGLSNRLYRDQLQAL